MSDMKRVDRFWSNEASNIRCVRESDYDALAAELEIQRQYKFGLNRDLSAAINRVAYLEAELQALKVVRHWIPVSERLPENDTPILVAYKFGGIYTCRCNVIDHDLTAVDPAHGERDRPTHWMPLPAGPHEGKSHE